MAKKKHGYAQPNQPASAPKGLTSAASNLFAGLVRQTKTEVEAIKPLVQEHLEAGKFESLPFDDMSLNGAPTTEVLEKWLKEVSHFSKELKSLYERRQDEVSRKEAACTRRTAELDKRESEVKKSETDIEVRKAELRSLESNQIEQDRKLIARELDARSGFAMLNAEALAALRKEVANLEARKEQLILEHHQAEQTARQNELDRTTDLMRREDKIIKDESRLTLAQRRLDAEWQDLEGQKVLFRQEAKADAELELRSAREAKQRAEERAERAFQACQSAEAKLDEYLEFETAMNGQSPRQLLDDLSAAKRAVAALENQLAFNQDDQLQAEKDALVRIRDEQKHQIGELNSELADAKAQLHRLRLGVTDKENLEREKRALEKSNQILGARLNELGKAVDNITSSQQADKPFPQLSRMDEELGVHAEQTGRDVPDLKAFAVELRHRIAQAEKGVELFYRPEDIQLLLAGLAMSQLHIFQGISGTGKTSLAKAFAKAMGGSCTDIAVQAGWRDRDDLLGHYNAFEKRFYEKDCLQGLYKASTPAFEDRCNIILLDEMNLSRPEQYFAEFLSALEKNDPKDRLISLSESKLPNPPSLLVEGRKVRVPPNLWFVGTANHDETTNEFADKTYDRAHVMTLPRHEDSFKIEPKQSATFSFKSLMRRFEEARIKHAEEVKGMLEDLTTGTISSVLRDRFELGWGNRFERQAMRFIPVFMEAGGTKEDALDHFLASRVLRRGKVTGRYDATIEDLALLERAVVTAWKSWHAEPSQCLLLLAKDRHRKERGA